MEGISLQLQRQHLARQEGKSGSYKRGAPFDQQWGVLRARGAGGDWSPLNEGLPNLSVTSLVIDNEGHLVAGMAGGGVYVCRLRSQELFQTRKMILHILERNAKRARAIPACLNR
jgi:hypothetical protein